MTLPSATQAGSEELLFGELQTDEPVFELEEELLPFGTNITQLEAKTNGRRAFLRWLHSEISGIEVTQPKALVPPVCNDEPEMFFPEYPDVEDEESPFYGMPYDEESEEFQNHPMRLAYQRAEFESYRLRSMARQACFSCAIKNECLDFSVIEFATDGVFGGWGDGGRKVIRNQFERLRREWNGSKLSAKVRRETILEAAELAGVDGETLLQRYEYSLAE